MRDLKTARLLLAAAERDLAALKRMTDADAFPVEVFGFHAQQAVEKSLKAWLSIRGLAHPRIHSLRLLLDRLENAGDDIETLRDLDVLTSFAVQFRYDAFDPESGAMDRDAILGRAAALCERVKALLARAE